MLETVTTDGVIPVLTVFASSVAFWVRNRADKREAIRPWAQSRRFLHFHEHAIAGLPAHERKGGMFELAKAEVRPVTKEWAQFLGRSSARQASIPSRE